MGTPTYLPTDMDVLARQAALSQGIKGRKAFFVLLAGEAQACAARAERLRLLPANRKDFERELRLLGLLYDQLVALQATARAWQREEVAAIRALTQSWLQQQELTETEQANFWASLAPGWDAPMLSVTITLPAVLQTAIAEARQQHG